MENKKREIACLLGIVVIFGIFIWGGVPKKETNVIARQNRSLESGENYQESGKEETLAATSSAIEGSKEPVVTTSSATPGPKVTKMYFKKKKVQIWQREKVYNPPVILEKGAAYQKISWSVSNKACHCESKRRGDIKEYGSRKENKGDSNHTL